VLRNPPAKLSIIEAWQSKILKRRIKAKAHSESFDRSMEELKSDR
jgi:hypothetical protein